MPTLHVKKNFIVLAVTLFSFSANAQITTTVSGGTSIGVAGWSFETLCGFNSSGYGEGVPSKHIGQNPVLITYSAPVTVVKIPFSSFGTTGGSPVRFDVLGQTNESLSSGCSSLPVSGNVVDCFQQNNYYGDLTISSSTPFTQIQVSSIENGSSIRIPQSSHFNANNLIVSAPSQCPSTPVIPTLNTVTLANICPATTANLTSITSSNTPANATLTWHASTPASNANKISTPTAVTAGTYRAAFYYAQQDCYSDNNGTGTRAVTVTINFCCNAGTIAPSFNQ